MPWRMIGSGAVQVNNLVQASLVSGVRGAINSLDTAFATLILPQAVIAQAISTALFPTISAHAARGDKVAFADTLTRAVRVIIALSAPATAGLIVLGQPIIALLFQRNAFTALDSERAGLALVAYATGLVGHSVLEIVTRAFYALKDNKPPVLFGVGSVIVNVVLSMALLPIAAHYTPHAFVAVALANAIATTLEAIILYVWLARREPALKLGGVWTALGKSALASIVMGLVLLAFRDFAPPGVLSTLAALLIGGAVYFATLFVLRSEELAYGVRLAMRKSA
jgi:putative peptidoglycan lipid II flippase